MPFLVPSAALGSLALWTLYKEGVLADEYKDYKVLALFVHNPGLIHTTTKRVWHTVDALAFPAVASEAELTIRFDGAICRTLHIGLMGGGLISWNAKLWGGGNGQARDPTPYALETEWPVGAAGLEPPHLNKDAPIHRAIQHAGRIVSAPVLGMKVWLLRCCGPSGPGALET